MGNLKGQSIGRYQVREPLGEGGMGTVYKAFDPRLERDVAVKVIRMENLAPSQSQLARKRFEREAKALARLSHPNIVGVIDYGEHEGAPYLVMEYLLGGTLQQRLGKVTAWQEVVRLVVPVARGLAYAHQHGIIHRDVKPSNILITESGEPMLTDFGIAKLLENEAGQTLTATGVGIGTPEYMSPEQGMGKPVDSRTDVYSLGIVFYELITGRKPFVADTPMGVVFKHLTEPLPPPTQFVPGLPESVESVLLKALAKEPEDRYPGMSALASALEALLISLPGPGQEFSPTPQAALQAPLETASLPAQLETQYTIDPMGSSAADTEAVHLLEGQVNIPGASAASTFAPRAGDWRWLAVGTGVLGLGTILILGVILVLGGTLLGRSLRSNDFRDLESTLVLEASTVLPRKTVLLPLRSTQMNTLLPPTATPFAGETRISKKDGMVQVYIPGGEFTMGSEYGSKDEKPAHEVNLDPYWIDQTEVTNAMYELSVTAGACSPPTYHGSFKRSNYYGKAGYSDYPVLYVSWDDAKAYCTWAGRRLPTEAEWEKAARGDDARTYPWGESAPSSGLLNYKNILIDTTKAGSYPEGASPYGALDMAGNVWEWVADWHETEYYGYSPFTNPLGPPTGTGRVVRGGSWKNEGIDVRSAKRFRVEPTNWNNYIGFRCASSSK